MKKIDDFYSTEVSSIKREDYIGFFEVYLDPLNLYHP